MDVPRNYTFVLCPFCGSTDLDVEEFDVKTVKLRPSGSIARHASLSTRVVCLSCGAKGPAHVRTAIDAAPLTDAVVNQAHVAAVLAWNGRDGAAETMMRVLNAIASKAVNSIKKG